MSHLYFHCAGSGEILLDERGSKVLDLAEARDHALSLARSIIAGSYGVSDFSDWLIYVADEDHDEVLLVPFAAAMPTLH
jgi:hypothetical protein